MKKLTNNLTLWIKYLLFITGILLVCAPAFAVGDIVEDLITPEAILDGMMHFEGDQGQASTDFKPWKNGTDLQFKIAGVTTRRSVLGGIADVSATWPKQPFVAKKRH